MSGTSTVAVDRDRMRQLYTQGANINFEALPASTQQLTFNYLIRTVQDVMKISDWHDDLLTSFSLYKPNHGFNQAAEIFSDTNSLPGIDIVRFGSTINEIRERITVENVSVLEQFDVAYQAYARNYTMEVIDSKIRRRVENLPDLAFREGLANALIHRDYSIQTRIRISMFDDRIEIASPGGLPGYINNKDNPQVVIAPIQNPIITMLFFVLGYTQNLTYGTKRTYDSYKPFVIQPHLQITASLVNLILPVTTGDKDNLSEHDRLIYTTLQQTSSLSRIEIMQRTGLSQSIVTRSLRKLVKQRSVTRIGKGRATAYRLTNGLS